MDEFAQIAPGKLYSQITVRTETKTKIIFLLMSQITLSRGSPGADLVKSYLATSQAPSKLWYTFIYKYQQSALTKLKQQVSKLHVGSFWIVMVKLSKIFGNRSRQYKILEYFGKYTMIKKEISGNFVVFKRNIERRLHCGEKQLSLFKNRYGNYGYFTWIYRLHPNLSLNLTLHHMFFSPTGGDCLSENLCVLFSPGYRRFAFYCESYSSFSLYSKTNYAKIVITSTKYVQYYVHSSFIIIDRGIIENIFPSYQGVLYVSVLQLLQKATYESFVVKGPKMSYIKLWFTGDQYIVHDGPDFKSKKLNSSKGMYICSTYQCSVQALHFLLKLLHVNFSSSSLSISDHVCLLQRNQTTLEVPQTILDKSPIVFFVSSGNYFQINATLTQMLSKTIVTKTCQYGGFSIFNTQEDEIFWVCEPHDGSVAQSKSIYSKSSSLLLLLYWYEGHGNISVSLILTQTRCKPVDIDPCRIQDQCNLVSMTYTKKCRLYLEELSQLSNAELTHNYHSTLYVSLDDDECPVLQVKQTNTFYHTAYCSCFFCLQPKPTLNASHTFQYEIKASLLQNLLVLGDYIMFKSTPDDFCFTSVSGALKCSSKPRSFSSKQRNTSFYVTTHFRSPILSSKVFTVKLEVARYTQSWIDIVTKRIPQKISQHADRNYFTETMTEHYNFLDHVKYIDDVALLLIAKPINKNKTWPNTRLYVRADLDTSRFQTEDEKMQTTTFQSHLFWTKVMSLSKLPAKQHIEIYGSLHLARIGTFEQVLAKNYFVTAVWKQNKLNKYLYMLDRQTSWCADDVTRNQFAFCANLSCSQSCQYPRRNNYIFFRWNLWQSVLKPHSPIAPSCAEKDIHKVKFSLKTWMEAYNTCISVAGFLPSFTNREELQEVVALVKLLKKIPALEAVYISLVLQKVFNGSWITSI